MGKLKPERGQGCFHTDLSWLSNSLQESPEAVTGGRAEHCTLKQHVETKLQIFTLTCPILTLGSPVVRGGCGYAATHLLHLTNELLWG